MKLFGKKKKEEEIEEEEELDEESKSTPKKKRSPKKEKPKEWTRKERRLVLFVLAITMALSGIFALSARSWKLPGLPRLSFKLPQIAILEEETIILEGDTVASTKRETIIEEFRLMTRNLSGVYGLYVTSVDGSFEVGINDDEQFEPASLNKLPVMLLAFRNDFQGVFDLDAVYTLRNQDKIGGSGSLNAVAEGEQYTYRKLVELMGQQSDNTAYFVVRNALGKEAVHDFVSELGMNQTFPDDNITSPRDIGLYFKALYSKNVVPERLRDELLGYLTDTIYEQWLPRDIPDSIQVAHKYGREVHVINDAGIVFADKPFVIVIMTKGIVEKEADQTIPEIANMVYQVMINTDSSQ